jgi:hypothetical protein
MGETMDDLRRWMTFQTVTKLKNYSTCRPQVWESTKCHLSKFPVWPKQGRSEGNALTQDFLAQYSAAVYVDLFHSLSLEEHTKDNTVKVTRTVPKVGPMIVRCGSVQNLVMGIQQWNTVANSRAEINEYTCFNLVRHRDPAKFDDQTACRTHVVECYGQEKGIGGQGTIFFEAFELFSNQRFQLR